MEYLFERRGLRISHRELRHRQSHFLHAQARSSFEPILSALRKRSWRAEHQKRCDCRSNLQNPFHPRFHPFSNSNFTFSKMRFVVRYGDSLTAGENQTKIPHSQTIRYIPRADDPTDSNFSPRAPPTYPPTDSRSTA